MPRGMTSPGTERMLDYNATTGNLIRPAPTADRHEDCQDSVDISVVIPVYNEAGNIAELVAQVTAVMDTLGKSYEVLIVDDGSTDGTGQRLAAEVSGDAKIRPIFLARNYGQSTAMQAGFDAATGETIVTLDGDLQNDPADIPLMLDLLETSGVDLVSGWRVDRKDGTVRKAVSVVANRLISALTKVRLHDYGCSLKVYRRQILERTRLYGELHRFLPALIFEAGGHITEVEVRHRPRSRGVSKYKLDRTFRVFLDLLLIMFLRTYMQRPLHLFGGIGLLLGGLGFLSLAYLTVLKLFTGAAIGDRPLLLFGIMSLLLGVTMIGQGLLGDVISRIYLSSDNRRQYYTREHPPPLRDGRQ